VIVAGRCIEINHLAAGRGLGEGQPQPEDDHPVPLSHLAKYRSLMPALALILHVIDGVDTGVGGPVSGVAAEHAAAWCRYLEAHAAAVRDGDGPGGRGSRATGASTTAAADTD
jgi:Protein of unknown function (DUF3987)